MVRHSISLSILLHLIIYEAKNSGKRTLSRKESGETPRRFLKIPFRRFSSRKTLDFPT